MIRSDLFCSVSLPAVIPPVRPVSAEGGKNDGNEVLKSGPGSCPAGLATA